MCRIILLSRLSLSSRWRHNGRDGVSNHQHHDYLLNRLFRHRSKKTFKLRVTGLCGGNSPGTGEFPAQMASNAESVSIWWRHHGYSRSYVRARDMNRVFHNNPYAWWLSGIPSTAHLKQYSPCVVLAEFCGRDCIRDWKHNNSNTKHNTTHIYGLYRGWIVLTYDTYVERNIICQLALWD